MLALTLWPEWPWAISVLGKPVENRTWAPPDELIGQYIALHSGKSVGGRPSKKATREGLAAMSDAATAVGVRLVSADAQPDGRIRMTTIHRGHDEPRISYIVLGAIVSVARVAAVIDETSEHPAADSIFFTGPLGWVLEDVHDLPEPIPCKGFQKLWDVPLPLCEEIYRQIPSVRARRTCPVAVNRHWYDGAELPQPYMYCGRGTPLGNPFRADEHGPMALPNYRRWLWGKIQAGDAAVMAALSKITPEHHLVCSCKPRPCHVDIIIAAWRWLNRPSQDQRTSKEASA